MKICLILLVCLIGMALAMPAPDAEPHKKRRNRHGGITFSLTLGGNHGHGNHRPQPYRPYRPQPVYSNGHDHHFNYPGVFTGGYGNGHGGYGGHGYRGPQ